MDIRFSYLNYLAPDAKALEADLSRRAEAGWALQWLIAGLACFRRTDRRDLRYCVELKPRASEEDEDYLTLCADAGWELAEETSVFRIFASRPGTCPAPLQTDAALDFQENWRTVLREARANALYLPMVFLIDLLFSLLFARSVVHWWEIFLDPVYLLFIPLLLLILAWDLGYFLWLGRFRRRCREAVERGYGLPLPSRRAARGRRFASAACGLAMAACLLLAFLPPFLPSGRISAVEHPGDQYPLVRAEDLGLPSSRDSGYLLWEGSSLLRHGEALTYSGDHLVRSVYYACRWERLARAVCASLVEEEGDGDALHFHDPVSLSPVDLGFDESWLYDGGDWQSLLLREGTVVASVEGPADLTDPAVLAVLRQRLGL